MSNNELFLEYIKTFRRKENFLFQVSENFLNTVELKDNGSIIFDFHGILYNNKVSSGYNIKCRKNAGVRKVYNTKKGFYFNNFGKREYLKDYKTYNNIVKFLESEEV